MQESFTLFFIAVASLQAVVFNIAIALGTPGTGLSSPYLGDDSLT